MGVLVGGRMGQTFDIDHDAQENSPSFDINDVVVSDGANMVFNDKLTKNGMKM